MTTTPSSPTDRPLPAIELQNVTKRFRTPKGGIFTALREFNLTIQPGEFCAVVGPTGCGKSTTLTLVSGLERPSDGTVTVAGRRVDRKATGQRSSLLRECGVAQRLRGVGRRREPAPDEQPRGRRARHARYTSSA